MDSSCAQKEEPLPNTLSGIERSWKRNAADWIGDKTKKGRPRPQSMNDITRHRGTRTKKSKKKKELDRSD